MIYTGIKIALVKELKAVEWIDVESLGKTKIEVNPNVDIGIASGGKNTGSGRNLN